MKKYLTVLIVVICTIFTAFNFQSFYEKKNFLKENFIQNYIQKDYDISYKYNIKKNKLSYFLPTTFYNDTTNQKQNVIFFGEQYTFSSKISIILYNEFSNIWETYNIIDFEKENIKEVIKNVYLYKDEIYAWTDKSFIRLNVKKLLNEIYKDISNGNEIMTLNYSKLLDFKELDKIFANNANYLFDAYNKVFLQYNGKYIYKFNVPDFETFNKRLLNPEPVNLPKIINASSVKSIYCVKQANTKDYVLVWEDFDGVIHYYLNESSADGIIVGNNNKKLWLLPSNNTLNVASSDFIYSLDKLKDLSNYDVARNKTEKANYFFNVDKSSNNIKKISISANNEKIQSIGIYEKNTEVSINYVLKNDANSNNSNDGLYTVTKNSNEDLINWFLTNNNFDNGNKISNYSFNTNKNNNEYIYKLNDDNYLTSFFNIDGIDNVEIRKNLDFSFLKNLKVDLDNELIKNYYQTSEISKKNKLRYQTYQNIYKKISLTNGFENIKSSLHEEDLPNLINVTKILDNSNRYFMTESKINNWLKGKEYTLGQDTDAKFIYTNGEQIGPKLYFSTHSNLNWTSNYIFEYKESIEAKNYVGDDLKNLIKNINSQILKEDQYLQIDESKIFTWEISNQNHLISDVDVIPNSKAKSYLTEDQINQLVGKIKIDFKNIIKSSTIDLEEVEKILKENSDVNQKLSLGDINEDIINWIKNILKDYPDLDKLDFEITNITWNDHQKSANVKVKVSQKNSSNSREFEYTLTNFANRKYVIDGKWLDNFDPDKMIENGYSGIYQINNFDDLEDVSVVSNDLNIATVSLENKNVKVVSKTAGNTSFTISASNAKQSLTINLSVYKESLDFGDIDISDIKIKQNKKQIIELKNYVVFEEVTIISSNESYLKANIEEGKIILEAIKYIENENTYQVNVKGTNIKNEVKTDTFSVTILPPAPALPFWAILLLAIFGALLALGLIIWLSWFLFIKYGVTKSRRKVSSSTSVYNILTSKNVNKNPKSKNHMSAKSYFDDGFSRSGVFKKDLKSSVSKMNEKNYQKKYVWSGQKDLEDASPAVNYWSTHKEQTKREIKTKTYVNKTNIQRSATKNNKKK
ncbi:hypothetical protein [Spiroplasma tabanidicola]|uniref:Uncharacterized protein n=1 Tax=Spiroplasma tabanidicola TaxID=324079 RepID=A0A6I6C981_9MOLU|nr:hypothetical protein [Spiroplasma tabanidicola]QGS52009.1 hypothetical protein STABA_v1c06480 [Spiroplasma tabanidicola]